MREQFYLGRNVTAWVIGLQSGARMELARASEWTSIFPFFALWLGSVGRILEAEEKMEEGGRFFFGELLDRPSFGACYAE